MFLCGACGQEDPPEAVTTECARCFRRVAKVDTVYDVSVDRNVCSGKEVEACAVAAGAMGRGGKRRRQATQAAQETEWIGCDGPCARWFHTSCVGGVVPSGTDDWFCPDCRTAAESDDEADVLPEGL